MTDKTLNNSDVKQARKQVKDIQFFGDGDMFKLLCKASSQAEGWMKSTKAMEIPGVGCVVQVTTQQITSDIEYDAVREQAVAEAVCFVPGVQIQEHMDDEGKVIGRSLVSIHPTIENKAE